MQSGSVFEIVNGNEDHHKMAEVHWAEIKLMMFAQDVQERSQLLNKSLRPRSNLVSRSHPIVRIQLRYGCPRV